MEELINDLYVDFVPNFGFLREAWEVNNINLWGGGASIVLCMYGTIQELSQCYQQFFWYWYFADHVDIIQIDTLKQISDLTYKIYVGYLCT